MKSSTLVKLISNELYYDKLIRQLEKDKDILRERWFILEYLDAIKEKHSGLELLREDKNVCFGVSGNTACLAAYTGNIGVLEYCIQEGIVTDWCSSNHSENIFDDFMEPQIRYAMLAEDGTIVQDSVEHFDFRTPISFTLPSGQLECFQLLQESGMICDFRDRKNFKLLSLCRNKKMWEYLVDHSMIDKSLLLIAAEYGYYYQNDEISDWLIKRFKLLEE